MGDFGAGEASRAGDKYREEGDCVARMLQERLLGVGLCDLVHLSIIQPLPDGFHRIKAV